MSRPAAPARPAPPAIPACVALAIVCALWCAVCAHDLERTQVLITFARDGGFVVEVKNDPRWLTDRMASVPGPFADRIVIWVDGREVRPEHVELIADAELATHRLRGTLPIDAKTLRWYYGLVGDPYPLVIRRADGPTIVEEVGGDAWSTTIDLTGQFERPVRWPIYVVALLALAGIAMRMAGANKAPPPRTRWTGEDTARSVRRDPP